MLPSTDTPVAALDALQRAFDGCWPTPVDPATSAQAVAAAEARIRAALPPSQAISQRDLEQRGRESVIAAQQQAARQHLDRTLPDLEQAVADAVRDVAAAQVARRTPQDGPVGLTAPEQAVLDQPSSFTDERTLYAASIVEARATRRLLADLLAATVITAATPPADLLRLAEAGTPAERRRADWLLDRAQPRTDGDAVAAARDFAALRARHATIRDLRVPPAVREAERAERAYAEALVDAAQFRLSTARHLQRERADLRGVATTPDATAEGLGRLRAERASAWARVTTEGA